MSISPGGEPAQSLRSGTARAFAVVTYGDATETRLEVLVFAGAGVVLFQHSAVYNGSGQTNVEVTGRDIFAGYVSAAQGESTSLRAAMDIARQASGASAKRVRTASVVNVARSLDSMLAALERYPLSLDRLDRLGAARDLAAEVDALGSRIMTEVSDDDLDEEVARLNALVVETVDTVASALSGIDANPERAWLDGTYTIQLRRNGQISVGFDWDVGPEGVAGTPVVSPTMGAGPTGTATPTEASAATPVSTATARPATATPMSQILPGPATAVLPATVLPPTTNTALGGPLVFPPTAASVGVEPPALATPVSPQIVVTQMGYPPPPGQEEAGPIATPAAQAMSQDEISPGATPAAPAGAARRTDTVRETPLAPQQVAEPPVARIIAMLSAVMLGLMALWLRARI